MSDYRKDFNDSRALTAREIQLDRAYAESAAKSANKCTTRGVRTREATVNGHSVYEASGDDIWLIKVDGVEIPSYMDVTFEGIKDMLEKGSFDEWLLKFPEPLSRRQVIDISIAAQKEVALWGMEHDLENIRKRGMGRFSSPESFDRICQQRLEEIAEFKRGMKP